MRRYRWDPQGLPSWYERLIVTVMAARSIIRGWDYCDGDEPGTSVVLEFAERALSLHWWGVLFLASGALMTLALVMRSQLTLILGTVLAVGAYLGITIAMTVSVAGHGLDGIRSPADTAGITALCAGYLVWCLIRWRMTEIRAERGGGDTA